MIAKLRRRFILLSSLSLFALLLIILAAMNVMNFRSVTASADRELEILAGNRGTFPVFLEEPPEKPEAPGEEPEGSRKDEGETDPAPHRGGKAFFGIFDREGSAERPYQSRFFSVLLKEDGTVRSTDISRIASVTETEAGTYAREVFDSGRTRGFRGDFRYMTAGEDGCVRVVFLDCSQELTQAKRFFLYGALVSLAGFLVVFLVLFLISGRIIRPIAEAYEKQKQFITDAGHEIRTPLSIIRVNTDVLEMEHGTSESLDDIRHEVDRLTQLTKDLVSLSRMEEEGQSLPMIDFPLSDVLKDTAEPFRTLFESEGKTLRTEIQPGLSVKGSESAVRQLTSILLDNARKYSPEASQSVLKLTRTGGHCLLSVSNPSVTAVSAGDLSRVFDRFYRTDSSRNSQTGGNGIGLSIARAIAEAHGARIRASTSDGSDFTVTVTFPR